MALKASIGNTRMVKQPLISIIVPSYKTSDYIAETLQSVFSQTYKNFEVFVVNDGCPETIRLRDALAPFLYRINYLEQPNRGPSAARNAAIQVSNGTFVVFLDSDDILMPDYLEEQISAIESDHGLGAVFPDAMIFGISPLVGRRFSEIMPPGNLINWESVVRRDTTVMVTAIIRRHALIDAGLFDETLRWAEDFDLWLRILWKGWSIANNPKVLVKYRQRPSSLSANTLSMLNCRRHVLEKYVSSTSLSMSQRCAVMDELSTLDKDVALESAKLALLHRDYRAALVQLRAYTSESSNAKLWLIGHGIRWFPWILRTAYLGRSWIYKAWAKWCQHSYKAIT